jgi:hypothetical protein
MSQRSVKEIMKSTTPAVQALVSDILKIEDEYKNYRDLSRLGTKETELCERIVKLLEKAIKK